jgi:hypothetical protein
MLLAHGPPVRPGTRIHLVLNGPGVNARLFDGVALREHATQDRASSLAIEFCDLSGEQKDCIQALVLSAMQQASAPAVLVVHRTPMGFVAITRELHVLGRRVILAMTPLETVRWLSDPETHITVILVAWPPDAEHGTEMLRFVREEFPEVRRIALRQGSAEGEQVLPSSGDVDAVLDAPWTHSELKAVLQGMSQPCVGTMKAGL